MTGIKPFAGAPATAATRATATRISTKPAPTAATLISAIRTADAGPVTAGTAIRAAARLTAAGKAPDAEILEATATDGGARVGGERFGPYELEQLLGRGGMGEVWRAFDTMRRRCVALKRLHPHLADSPQFQLRFRREAALAARLNDPHVIPIHDYGDVDGRMFIDMRLVEGIGLNTLLSTFGPLDPARAVDIVSQTAGALAAAHDEGLVHRDVKPSNVLLTDKGSDGREARDFVYLVDFGIAHTKEATSMTSTGFTVGTLAYMAPERFDGLGDHRVDVYALGCLLHEALTASKPFPVEGLPALLKAHLNTPPPRPSRLRPGVPAALDEVVATAMAKAPGDRYPTATALALAARAAVAPARRARATPPAPARPPALAPAATRAPGAMPAAQPPQWAPTLQGADPLPTASAPPARPKPAAPAARPKPAVPAARPKPPPPRPRRKSMMRRVMGGVFLTVFVALAALIALAALLVYELPGPPGLDSLTGRAGHSYQQRHNGQGRG